MRVKHDPLAPHPRQKKANETPDETEQRLSADLRILMNDERYQKNDGDFRNFVQRQFRRVYDDPTGAQPEGLEVGQPKVFVTDLEPFDRGREQRLRRGKAPGDSKVHRETMTSKGALASGEGRSQTTRASQLGAANKGSEKLNLDNGRTTNDEPDIFPPSDRAMTNPKTDGQPRATPTPGIADVRNEKVLRLYQEFVDAREQREEDVASARWRSEKFLQMTTIKGFDEAKRAHEHYLEGSGEPLIVDSKVVRDYEPVINAEADILGHLKDWFQGKQSDSRFGRPWFNLADGKRIVIGEESFDADRVGKLVHWETTFDGSQNPLESEFWTDARMTFSSGTLESFSQLTLERHGDRIEISGFVKLRVADRYDFKENHLLKSAVLEEHGDAKSFDISTTLWVRPISGWIDISGSPVSTVRLNYDD